MIPKYHCNILQVLVGEMFYFGSHLYNTHSIIEMIGKYANLQYNNICVHSETEIEPVTHVFSHYP